MDEIHKKMIKLTCEVTYVFLILLGTVVIMYLALTRQFGMPSAGATVLIVPVVTYSFVGLTAGYWLKFERTRGRPTPVDETRLATGGRTARLWLYAAFLTCFSLITQIYAASSLVSGRSYVYGICFALVSLGMLVCLVPIWKRIYAIINPVIRSALGKTST